MMNAARTRYRICSLGLLGFVITIQTAGQARGQEQDAGQAIDPQAVAELKKMTALLDSSKNVLIQSRTHWEAIQESGMKLQFSAEQEIGIQRPDRMYSVTRNDDGSSRKLWYGDGKLTHLDVVANHYAQVDVPAKIDDMVNHVLAEYAIPAPPMLDFLYSDSETSFLDDVDAAQYVGQSKVGERPCHHLAFSKEHVDYQIWIPVKGKPLPLKYAITWTDDPNLPWFIADFTGWDVTASFSAGAFAVTLPSGAEKIEPQAKAGADQ